ncbi:glycoprotein 3-alpha-L-fucosyltransferase A-like [Haliotis rufescens]|uniref:glycoprotein 3-alpha-L-fucosyltransferase A-like n=1 Tax=Haliotis rufescens TaxID=6454 RepID=UPI00201F3632|nr:glycoprotein 3-alpha-L-fucosyltransferase A-like [Haliotis rufescens]
MAGLRQLKTQLVHPCRVLGRGAVAHLTLLVGVVVLVMLLFRQSNDSFADKQDKTTPKPKTTTTLKQRVMLPGGVKDESELFKEDYEYMYGIPNYALVIEKVKKVAYKPIKVSTKEESVKMRPLKRLAWLNSPPWMAKKENIDFSACAVSDCVMSLNSSDVPAADVVLVHADLLKDWMVPNNNPDQIWVFHTAETIYQFYNPRAIQRADWIGRFNWTLSFRLDSDFISTYSRLTLKDDFVDTANYTDIVLRKTRSVLWFVSHCKTQSKRGEYVKELRKYIDVDIYGKCGNLTCAKGQRCDGVWSNYWFYLSFENSLCKDYVTEKFFNPFKRRIVPVVRGGSDYRTLFPPDLYINTADFPSPRALAEHLKALQQDLPGYTKILRNMAKYKPGGNFLKGIPFICDMCAKLHQPLVRKTYKNIYKWWTEGICFDAKDY